MSATVSRQRAASRQLLVVATALILFIAPAWSCGPDFPDAVFVLPHGPGGAYAQYAAGRIGVPQPGYFTRHLVVAFDWISGRGLSPAEQKQAIAADSFLSSPDWVYPSDDAKKATGLAAWSAARIRFGTIPGEQPFGEVATERTVPGEDYTSFQNCLDDAFSNAAKTLTARQSTYSSNAPALRDWVVAQDSVFTNCGDGKAPQYFGPGTPPPPPPQPRMPADAPADAPLWLKQDRAYQRAAAQFYALQYEAAAKSFSAIAADNSSPWSPLAPYLAARAYIRQATIAANPNTYPEPKNLDLVKEQNHAALQRAHDQLLRVGASQSPVAPAARSLQDFVDARLQPDIQAIVLANRLHGTAADTNFEQALIDLTYLRTNITDASQPLPPHGPRRDSAGMLAWMEAISGDKSIDPVARWRAEKSETWLLAALINAQPNDPAVPDLLQSAAAVAPSSKAFIAISYQRLRLMPPNDAMRTQLHALLPRIRSSETLSTANLFTELEARSATSLKSWLAAAQRTEVGESDNNGVTEDATQPPPPPSTPPAPPLEDVCGSVIKPGTQTLFDEDAAFALNHDFSLARLAEAAEAGVLPANLRFQVAQAAWARAVLLDQPAIARRMTPLLIACRPAWKQVLPAYDNAASATDRQAAALLALERFASTEPSVRSGEERRNAFAAYDTYRQNWWCTTVPPAGETVDNPPPPAATAPRPQTLAVTFAPPLFLSSSDKAEAATELTPLIAVPGASTYIGQSALAWSKAHPQDPRTPDILGEAIRVVRNSCRDDATPTLAHALFDTLHKDYPQSVWAKRYTSWE